MALSAVADLSGFASCPGHLASSPASYGKVTVSSGFRLSVPLPPVGWVPCPLGIPFVCSVSFPIPSSGSPQQASGFSFSLSSAPFLQGGQKEGAGNIFPPFFPESPPFCPLPQLVKGYMWSPLAHTLVWGDTPEPSLLGIKSCGPPPGPPGCGGWCCPYFAQGAQNKWETVRKIKTRTAPPAIWRSSESLLSAEARLRHTREPVKSKWCLLLLKVCFKSQNECLHLDPIFPSALELFQTITKTSKQGERVGFEHGFKFPEGLCLLDMGSCSHYTCCNVGQILALNTGQKRKTNWFG